MRYHKKLKTQIKNIKIFVFLVCVFGFLFLIFGIFMSGCGHAPIVKKTRLLMDTWVSIKAHDRFRSPKKIKELIDKAFSGMERVDELTSRFREDSEISRINRLRPDKSIKVSPQTLMAINKAGDIYKITDGAFDITVTPLVKLWGFYGNEKHAIPSEEEIREALELVGQEDMLVDKEYGYVGLSKKGAELDLSGIAKGFAVDEAVNILKREGIRNALIDAGGDIYCLGSAPDGKPWKVGVRHPRKNKIISTLELGDIAVATSGGYEKYLIIDGKRFSHIIDPRSGYPARQMPLSVTVLARDCATADGLATALSVLGPENGLLLIDELEQTEAIIISDEGSSLRIDLSEGLKGLYEFKE